MSYKVEITERKDPIVQLEAGSGLNVESIESQYIKFQLMYHFQEVFIWTYLLN